MHHRSAPPLSHRATTYLVRLVLAALLWPSLARADEPMPESVMVDRLADGDLDAFDTVGPLRRGESRGRYRGLSLSLGAHAALGPERTEHGVFVVVGIPLDAALPAPRPIPDLRGIYTNSPPVERAVLRAPGVGTNEGLSSGPRPPGAPYVRAIVAAAERAQGVSSGFGRLDALAGRARTSGLLPELRLRATRYVDDRAQVDALADQSRLTDTSSKNLGLEARLTFRLDRVVFADEEPALEHALGSRSPRTARRCPRRRSTSSSATTARGCSRATGAPITTRPWPARPSSPRRSTPSREVFSRRTLRREREASERRRVATRALASGASRLDQSASSTAPPFLSVPPAAASK
ncbi:MAG: hypothetical protein U0183_21065 [Polyangiaceae bacterium]